MRHQSTVNAASELLSYVVSELLRKTLSRVDLKKCVANIIRPGIKLFNRTFISYTVKWIFFKLNDQNRNCTIWRRSHITNNYCLIIYVYITTKIKNNIFILSMVMLQVTKKLLVMKNTNMNLSEFIIFDFRCLFSSDNNMVHLSLVLNWQNTQKKKESVIRILVEFAKF